MRAGDVFGPTEGGRNLELLQATLKEPALERPEWIALDSQAPSARLTHLPEGSDAAPFPLDVQRVVEYYATRI